MPLAVSSALWFSLSGFAGCLFSFRALPLCEFRFPPEYHPTDPSRPTEAFRLLSWASVPYGTDQDRRSTASRALPARFVPPSGFGYPLDGFLPAIPSRFCFTPAAPLGFTLRSIASRQVSRCLHPKEPTYRSARRCSQPRQVGIGPARQASVAGLHPCPESRIAVSGFSTTAIGSSLGFCPSRAYRKGLGPGFHPSSSHTLRPPSHC